MSEPNIIATETKNGTTVEARLTGSGKILIVESDLRLDQDGPVEAVLVSPQFIFELATEAEGRFALSRASVA